MVRTTFRAGRDVNPCIPLCALLPVLFPLVSLAPAQEVFTPDHVAKVRTAVSAEVSPDGKLIAYELAVPRKPYKEESGPAWTELHVIDADGKSRPYVTGEVNVSSISWTPDGKGISFLAKRGGDEHKSLYVIPIDGGEARNILTHETDISSYSWSPDGSRVAILAQEKDQNKKEKKKLEDKGFNAEAYEEEQRPVFVWIAAPDHENGITEFKPCAPRKLDLPGSASELHWSPGGGQLVVALAPSPSIDDYYMARKVHVVDVESGRVAARLDNPGKIDAIAWSPDGTRLAMISAEDLHDPAEGRLMVAPASDSPLRDLVPGFEGHVSDIEWQDDATIMYLADEGVWTTLNEIRFEGTDRKNHVAKGRWVLRDLSLSRDGQVAAMLGSSPTHPWEVFVMRHGDSEPRRLTDSNPWLSDVRLAPQEVIQYQARDGIAIEGLLIHPLDEQPGTRYPLIATIHGGPESHYSNGWVTRYADPGQLAAARGYAVFYLNYRGSTGRGVAFSKLDQADYADEEFNDIVDGVKFLVGRGLADEKRVGVTGGSYGGFATAWCSTFLTEHFAAGVMFVGISDHISKAGTTDIPNEMTLVHARKRVWEDWGFFLERSPIRYVEQARTPLLILHGKDDPRVHPSQSLELYRHLKVLGQTPVRLVWYPGEGHGNRKSAARYDYNVRMMRWFDHYLKGPGGDPPPYRVDYGFEDSEEDAGEPARDDD